jgi:hypothetical protein
MQFNGEEQDQEGAKALPAALCRLFCACSEADAKHKKKKCCKKYKHGRRCGGCPK